MRTTFRRIAYGCFHFAGVCCFAALVVVGFCWLRSFWISDSASCNRFTHSTTIETGDGYVSLSRTCADPASSCDFSIALGDGWARAAPMTHFRPVCVLPGFGGGTGSYEINSRLIKSTLMVGPSGIDQTQAQPIISFIPETRNRTVVFPYWLILVVLVPFPLFWFMVALRRRLPRSRNVKGLCEACGYDLRMTPLQCPECGLVPSSTRPAGHKLLPAICLISLPGLSLISLLWWSNPLRGVANLPCLELGDGSHVYTDWQPAVGTEPTRMDCLDAWGHHFCRAIYENGSQPNLVVIGQGDPANPRIAVFDEQLHRLKSGRIRSYDFELKPFCLVGFRDAPSNVAADWGIAIGSIAERDFVHGQPLRWESTPGSGARNSILPLKIVWDQGSTNHRQEILDPATPYFGPDTTFRVGEKGLTIEAQIAK